MRTGHAGTGIVDACVGAPCAIPTPPPLSHRPRCPCRFRPPVPEVWPPGMLISETGQRRAADPAVADLHEQVCALQTQLVRERAETARLRDEVAQLRTQTREDFELNTAAAESVDRELITLMTDHEDISGLRELAEDNDSTAAVRLAELLCERQEIKAAISTLKPFAQRSHAASEFLVRLLVSQEDLPSLCELATAGGIFAAKELVRLAVSQGSYDDLNTAIRTLAVMERDVGGCYPIIALTRLRRRRRAWEREREQVPIAQH